MKNLWKEFKTISKSHWIIATVAVTLFMTYGYQLTHPTVGMDDTNVRTYFIDGLAPQVGRWTLFLLNKIFFMAEYTPYFMDFLGLVLLGCSACLFCILFKRVSCNRIHTLSYVFFSVLFVTSPFMGEVYIYYLHNGVGLAFTLIAISLLCLWDVTNDKKYWEMIPAAICVAMAIGCYESFALVYIIGVCIVYFLETIYGSAASRKIQTYMKNAGFYILPLVLAIILRRIISTIITNALDIELSQRTASSMKYWIMNNPLVLLKDLIYQFLLRYFISGKYFFGAFAFASAVILFLGIMIYYGIKLRKGTVFLYGAAILVAPWLLMPVELTVTPYRACQAVMLFVGFVWMCLINILWGYEGIKKSMFLSIMKYFIVVIGSIILFNQGFQLNAYFYYDTLKDKNDEQVCTAVGNELLQHHDVSKPVVFTGSYMMPRRLIDWFYVPVDTEEYYRLGKTLDSFNRIGFYNYVNEYGYKKYEVGSEDLINWMLWAALDGKKLEIYNYMYMLGYDFIVPTKEQQTEAEKQIVNMPAWPEEGSIYEAEEYIIVNFQKSDF